LWDSAAALDAIYIGGTDQDKLDLSAERARLAKEQADKCELENAERRKELLPAESVKKRIVDIITSAKTRLSGMPAKVSALTDDLDERRRIFAESKSIVDESLTELGRIEGYK